MSARDLFYDSSKTWTKREERLFAREEFVYNVTEDLLVILEKLAVSKSDLAKRLGKSKSYVTQILSGSRNMTLGTLSDMCFELDLNPKIVLEVGEKAKQIEGLNVHCDVETGWTAVSTPVTRNNVKRKDERRLHLVCNDTIDWQTAA